ncbi:alpha-1,6-mannosylglycoprotein 6-beta-N-acetylglucosaminyltransferase A-like isoform X1 [Mizuhopecten yessoensis]|uniref:alpha-1,6-mannosylglycoprotein 6-beta-N-acetylglucosaminyltransferase A-like isoform X1 n=1 Tax=Mizuhopecten yessoensis TaxID=6573 RepID=UPI000B45B0D3|nr:alpha-1,6-mannosylglycoprotein 6-beta-N-acetylglucosaminyltransferase A-like isoform X1 [Mizuhopecten yessoensis]
MAVTLWRMCGRIPNSRQLLLLACLLFFFWCVTLYRMSTTSGGTEKESEILKNEIIQLSENYVRALARENSDIVDGPYAGRFTAYDLKKTMAVLLESMLERLNKLEIKINNAINGTNGTNSNVTNGQSMRSNYQLRAEDLIQGKVEQCDLTTQEKQLYPHCNTKIEWMKAMWKSDPCYQSYGVDGSICSFVMYLSEIEGWCPTKAWRGNIKPPKEDMSKVKFANVTTDLQALMKILVDPNERQSYAWIRMRIRRLWDKWTGGITRLTKKQNLEGRRRKKILVHLGLLSKQSGWGFAENQFKGGPLGELVQWSDLLSTLFILGHDLIVTSETDQLAGILSKLPAANSPCQSRADLPVHIIYTDIVGLTQFRKHVKGGYAKFRSHGCLLRIVDSFGTEPAYNHRVYAKAHKLVTFWGGQNLQPQQFFTMFPHSPDNSFMGFLVEQHLNDSRVQDIKRRDQAVVYGKREYMWEGRQRYLEVIKNAQLDIHGTVYFDQPNNNTQGKKSKFPSYVTNHGFLNGEDLHYLLRQSKIFVGLGFPYEGPAPLEAIANGCVFINPRFKPPHSSKNTPFFKGKPTQRQVTSQHPYAEQFIGEPYVYTIDINNLNEVKDTVAKILENKKFQPYLPYEFTEEGMLQRMNAYIEHQNFCEFQKRPAKWPPSSSIKFLLGEPDKSCQDVCWSKSLMCEPSHFRELNSMDPLTKYGVSCKSGKSMSDIYYPAYDINTAECIIQKEEILFSCVGQSASLQRLCPCRTFIKGQSALCEECVR